MCDADSEIVFLRHAQSAYNATRDEARDSPLTREGRAQARALELGAFDYVLCSPLARARETLALARWDAPACELCSLAREALGDDFAPNQMAGEHGLRESDAAFRARMRVLRGLVAGCAARYGRVLVVAHAGVIAELTGVAPHNAERVTRSLCALLMHEHGG